MKTIKVLVIVIAMAGMWIGGYLLAQAADTSKAADDSTTPSAAPSDSAAVLPHKVVAYYFHGNVRCATCRRMETYTRDAIDSGYVTDLKNGTLEVRIVNIDLDENKHFVDEYKLFTRTVILSDLHNGKENRWKNLDKIWELNGDKTEFTRYIQTEVKAFLDPAM